MKHRSPLVNAVQDFFSNNQTDIEYWILKFAYQFQTNTCYCLYLPYNIIICYNTKFGQITVVLKQGFSTWGIWGVG